MPIVKGRNVGDKYSKYSEYSTELGVTKFQDFLLAINDRPERQLTDEELSEAMAEEHPGNKRIPPDFRMPDSVRSIRRRYNIGSQNHGPAKAMSRPYWIERVPRDYPDPYKT